jgi:Protein of unknown function (DUF3303)
MKVMLTWTIAPERIDDVVKYFLAGKEKIPKGLKLVGRWHSAGNGWALLEADDVPTVYRFTDQWESMVRFLVTPVMDAAETAVILTSR